MRPRFGGRWYDDDSVSLSLSVRVAAELGGGGDGDAGFRVAAAGDREREFVINLQECAQLSMIVRQGVQAIYSLCSGIFGTGIKP